MDATEAKRRLDLIESEGGFWKAWKIEDADLIANSPFDDLTRAIKFVDQSIVDFEAYLRAVSSDAD